MAADPLADPLADLSIVPLAVPLAVPLVGPGPFVHNLVYSFAPVVHSPDKNLDVVG